MAWPPDAGLRYHGSMGVTGRRQLAGRGLAFAGLCALLCASSHGSVEAASQVQSLALSASVVASCSIDASTELALGVYDLSAVAPTDSSGNLTVSCSSGSPVVIMLGQGTQPAPGSTDAVPLRRMTAGGAGRLQYELYRDPARSQVWGNTPVTGVSLIGSSLPQVVSIYARVPPAQPVSSGSYQDSVLATVSY